MDILGGDQSGLGFKPFQAEYMSVRDKKVNPSNLEILNFLQKPKIMF